MKVTRTSNIKETSWSKVKFWLTPTGPKGIKDYTPLYSTTDGVPVTNNVAYKALSYQHDKQELAELFEGLRHLGAINLDSLSMILNSGYRCNYYDHLFENKEQIEKVLELIKPLLEQGEKLQELLDPEIDITTGNVVTGRNCSLPQHSVY